MKTELRWVQCANKMAKVDADELYSFIEKVKVTSYIPSSSASSKAASTTEEGVRFLAQQEAASTTEKGVRFLIKQDSEVSVNSDGSVDIYKCLRTDACDTDTVCYQDYDELKGESGNEKEEHSDDHEDSIPEFTPVPPTSAHRKLQLESQGQVLKRPSADKKRSTQPIMKRPSADSKASLKRPAAADVAHGIEYLPVLGNQQSYICVKDEQGNKRLWVAISQKQSPNHADLINHIVAQSPASKEESLQMRAALL